MSVLEMCSQFRGVLIESSTIDCTRKWIGNAVQNVSYGHVIKLHVCGHIVWPVGLFFIA